MTTKFTCLFICLFASLSLYGQTRYFEFISKADSLLESENYLASAQFFEKAISEKEGTKRDHFNTACAYAMTKTNDEKAIDHLRKSIKKGMYKLSNLDTDEQLSSLKNHPRWESIRQELITSKAKFESGFNIPLKNKLEQIFIQDQTLRKVHHMARKGTEIDSAGMVYIGQLMQQEDSICQKEVMEIIEKHGWLGINEVGEIANRAIWSVIQHAPLEIQEKYYPMMEASVKAGQSDGSNFAYLVDRILMRKGEKQIYGSQYRFNRKTRERYFYPIRDHESVNKRREDVGLMPIEEYARLIRLEYDPSIWEE